MAATAAAAAIVLTACVLTACGGSPGSLPSDVSPVHRADSSGSTFLFTSYLNAQDPSSGTEQLAQVNFQPLPSSIVTLSDAQIAKIKG
jgi:ABC-type phosphate transport system substrate-binding protein